MERGTCVDGMDGWIEWIECKGRTPDFHNSIPLHCLATASSHRDNRPPFPITSLSSSPSSRIFSQVIPRDEEPCGHNGDGNAFTRPTFHHTTPAGPRKINDPAGVAWTTTSEPKPQTAEAGYGRAHRAMECAFYPGFSRSTLEGTSATWTHTRPGPHPVSAPSGATPFFAFVP